MGVGRLGGRGFIMCYFGVLGIVVKGRRRTAHIASVSRRCCRDLSVGASQGEMPAW